MTQRERRVVLGGAVAVVVILLAALIPRLAGGDEGENLEAARVARLRGLVASEDTVAAATVAALEREAATVPRYLGGGTPQVAAASLSTILHDIAARSQVEIVRESVLPPRAAGDATVVPLQVVAAADLPGLLDLLAGIERAPQLLTVESIVVGADPRPMPGAASLNVTLQVAGYVRRPLRREES